MDESVPTTVDKQVSTEGGDINEDDLKTLPGDDNIGSKEITATKPKETREAENESGEDAEANKRLESSASGEIQNANGESCDAQLAEEKSEKEVADASDAVVDRRSPEGTKPAADSTEESFEAVQAEDSKKVVEESTAADNKAGESVEAYLVEQKPDPEPPLEKPSEKAKSPASKSPASKSPASKSPREHDIIIPTAASAPMPSAGKETNVKQEPKDEESAKEEEKSSEDGEPATVNFELQPDKRMMKMAVSNNQSIADIGQPLSDTVAVPIDSLKFSYKEKELQLSTKLNELGVEKDGSITIQVASTDPHKHPIRTPVSKPPGLPDVMTVRVAKGTSEELKEVRVKVEKCKLKKPFLGGFKHKLTGIQYHNASVQTNQKPLRWPKNELFNRDTQTVLERRKEQQTYNTTSTQMTVKYCYMSVMEDKVIEAKPYFTSRQFLKQRLEAVICIQRYARRWLAQRLCARLRVSRDKRIEWEESEEKRKRREKLKRLERECERRMHPKTKQDFELVYAALEKWRMEEMANINSEMLDEPTRKAAMCTLLEQETQLIASIGKHKNIADKINHEEAIGKLLDKAAAPKRWRAFDGRYTEMDTKYTLRGKELRDIYNSINMKYLTQDERLDVLLTLKHTVKEHDCKLTREIIGLIDREADLIMRAVSDSNLEGLRKRISTLFVEYCKNPMFNPEVARYLRVPQDPTNIKHDVYYCNTTMKFLPAAGFKYETGAHNYGKGKSAYELDNIARTRKDTSVFRNLLRNVRRMESENNNDCKIPFLMQEKDMQYLCEAIWVSQSIVSGWDDCADLQFVRWNKRVDWSPWNCILLTKDEAIAHLNVDSLLEAYGQVFADKIRHKHALARVYFSKLPGMSEQIRAKASTKMLGQQEVRGKNLLSSH